MTAPHRGFSGPMKQSTKQQNTTTTTVKNPNWPETNQLAIYKCSWEVEPGTTRNKFIEWSERVLNPESPDLKASALTTGPHCLLYRRPGSAAIPWCHTLSRSILGKNVCAFSIVFTFVVCDVWRVRAWHARKNAQWQWARTSLSLDDANKSVKAIGFTH